MEAKLVLQKRDVVVIALAKLFFPHLFDKAFSRMQAEWIHHFFGSRVCFEAPPYFGKTMVISFLKSIFSALGLVEFLRDFNLDGDGWREPKFLQKEVNRFYKEKFRGREIFIGSDTGTKAEDILRNIKLELESNQLLRSCFGDQVGKEKWTEDHIILTNGSQVVAKGRAYQFRNFHPQDLILDDIQTDENATLGLFEDDWKWFSRTIISRKPANLHVIGNRLTDYSIVARVSDHYQGRFNRWVTRKYYALDEVGQTTWKAGMPQEELEKLQEDMGPTMFAQEYMGQTSADQDIAALRSRLHFYAALPKDTHFVSVCAIDPAFTRDSYKISSETGLAIFSIAQRGAFAGKAFLTRIERQKLLVDGVAEWMIELQKKHFFTYIGLEDVTSSKGLKALFLEKCRNQRIPVTFSFVDLPATKSKQARLADVMPLIENGTALFDETDPTQKSFIEEELLTRGIGTNDRLDAYVHGLTIIKDNVQGGLYSRPSDWDEWDKPVKRKFAVTGRPI